MERIILVEDSKFFANLVIKKLKAELEYPVAWVTTFADARTLVESEGPDFTMAFLDLNLPDSPRGEVVDYFLGKNIPVIVFTGEFSEQVRDTIMSKHVVDYVVKANEASLDLLVDNVQRIKKNRSVEVLVVDDSTTARTYLRGLLEAHRFQVLEADTTDHALAQFKNHPDIKLVITDYNMPGRDGLELVRELRTEHPKGKLAILGISSQNEALFSAKFIKAGANDFLNKPFLTEEFYCRVLQNIELVEYVERIEHLSNNDPLTGLSNRRHFFKQAETLFEQSRSGGPPLTMAMLDIDHFKRVNDTYGHPAGDAVLKHVARLLRDRFGKTGLVARFGGEEFCILQAAEDSGKIADEVEAFRRVLEASKITTGGQIVEVTLSAGVCCQCVGSLEEMIRSADALLYQAKENGRNQVRVDD